MQKKQGNTFAIAQLIICMQDVKVCIRNRKVEEVPLLPMYILIFCGPLTGNP